MEIHFQKKFFYLRIIYHATQNPLRNNIVSTPKKINEDKTYIILTHLGKLDIKIAKAKKLGKRIRIYLGEEDKLP